MKFFDVVRSLTSTITNIFAKKESSEAVGRNKPIKNQAERNKKAQKTKKKRPTYGSFSKKHDSSVKSTSSRIKKSIRRASLHAQDHQQFKKMMKNEDDQWSNGYNLQEKNTNQIIPSGNLIREAEPLFTDKDGLEISVIQRDSRSEVLNSDVQSDQEILKFIYGEEELQKKTSQEQKKISNEVVYIRKQWWREALQKSQISNKSLSNYQVSNLQEQNQSAPASGIESSVGSQLKSSRTKKIRHINVPKHWKKNALRVLNMMDLVADEDNPKQYQIPLKVENSK